MVRNYLLITWRNLQRSPLYLALNILGLTLGVAASLLVWQYVVYESSYDVAFPDKEHIYRVELDRYNKGELGSEWAAGAAAAGPVLKDKFPEVEELARFYSWEGVFTYRENAFRESRSYFATASVLDMFSLKELKGNVRAGLERPFTVALTEEVAKKYFGDLDPVGKVIEVSNIGDLEVVGVIEGFPEPSHFDINIFISFPTVRQMWNEQVDIGWYWDGWFAYVRLKQGTDPKLLASKLNTYLAETEKDFLAMHNHRMEFSFMPITDIHLHSNILEEFKPNGDHKTVRFLSLIGVLILIIAWINYINLSTARAADRSKEVGVRKTNGATKKDLISQFLFDAFVINLIAGGLGLSLYQLTKPLLNSLGNIPESFALWNEPLFFPIFIGVLILGSLLSGLYPAFVLASFKPINALKGYLNIGGSSLSSKITHAQLRSGLVVFQFAASIILIAATFTIYRQLRFMQTQEKGFSMEQTVVINGPSKTDSTYSSRMSSFLKQVQQVPGVIQTATSNTVPGIIVKNNAGAVRRWGADESEGKEYDRQFMSPEYLDIYNIDLVAGENFSFTPFKDTNYVIFNEAAVTHMGFDSPEEAIGAQVNVWGQKLTIKGVMQDYFHRSLKQHPIPTLFIYEPYCQAYQSIRIEEAALLSALPEIQAYYTESFPGNPYEYFFADEQYGKLYVAEKSSGRIFALFSMLAVVVACLGLFGLISYTLVRRTKEIGIRKVLGASYQNILQLLLKDFSYLVLISGVIAIPFTFWAISSWLKEYPYRISLNWDLFLIPIVLVMLLALLTILRSTLVSAHAKPIESLRRE